MAHAGGRREALSGRIQEIGAGTLEGSIAEAIVRFLKESEAKLIRLLDGQHPPDSEPGSVELGLTLYGLKSYELLHPLWDLLGKPEPRITGDMLAGWETELRGAGIVASDGTLIAYSRYAQLDFGLITETPGSFLGWAESLVEYLYYLVHPGKIHPFRSGGPTVSMSGSRLTLALLGDWGTGAWSDGTDKQGPASVLMDQAMRLENPPDLTIHLGDVYYVGSPGTDGAETQRFVERWKGGSQGSFTLNSNHEMYAGARGYFEDATTAPVFSRQNEASYFAVEFGPWTVVGLDSAYDARFPDNTPVPFYMQGRVTDEEQRKFVEELDLEQKQVIVLTHHNPVSTDGKGWSGELWKDVTGALSANRTFRSADGKGAPQYWFWGHLHNGIVYNERSRCGQQGTRGRCTGHSAIPFGSAYGLIEADGSFAVDTVDYVAHTPYSNYAPPSVMQENRVLNGFTVLTLTEGCLTEDWYEQGNTHPVWTHSTGA